jgi:hypothetical protein
VTEHLSQIPTVNSSFNPPNFALPPSFLGIYGTHYTFRDILHPNPLFAPYSLAATRSNIYPRRVKTSASQTWRVDN